MRVSTDDEVYRVDAVWLGPENVTWPWRARYVAWGVGIVVWLGVWSILHSSGAGVGFFPLAWSVVLAVAITRGLTSRITHERPLLAVLALAKAEVSAPRQAPRRVEGAPTLRRVRIRPALPARPGGDR